MINYPQSSLAASNHCVPIFTKGSDQIYLQKTSFNIQKSEHKSFVVSLNQINQCNKGSLGCLNFQLTNKHDQQKINQQFEAQNQLYMNQSIIEMTEIQNNQQQYSTSQTLKTQNQNPSQMSLQSHQDIQLSGQQQKFFQQNNICVLQCDNSEDQIQDKNNQQSPQISQMKLNFQNNVACSQKDIQQNLMPKTYNKSQKILSLQQRLSFEQEAIHTNDTNNFQADLSSQQDIQIQFKQPLEAIHQSTCIVDFNILKQSVRINQSKLLQSQLLESQLLESQQNLQKGQIPLQNFLQDFSKHHQQKSQNEQLSQAMQWKDNFQKQQQNNNCNSVLINDSLNFPIFQCSNTLLQQSILSLQNPIQYPPETSKPQQSFLYDSNHSSDQEVNQITPQEQYTVASQTIFVLEDQSTQPCTTINCQTSSEDYEARNFSIGSSLYASYYEASIESIVTQLNNRNRSFLSKSDRSIEVSFDAKNESIMKSEQIQSKKIQDFNHNKNILNLLQQIKFLSSQLDRYKSQQNQIIKQISNLQAIKAQKRGEERNNISLAIKRHKQKLKQNQQIYWGLQDRIKMVNLNVQAILNKRKNRNLNQRQQKAAKPLNNKPQDKQQVQQQKIQFCSSKTISKISKKDSSSADLKNVSSIMRQSQNINLSTIMQEQIEQSLRELSGELQYFFEDISQIQALMFRQTQIKQRKNMPGGILWQLDLEQSFAQNWSEIFPIQWRQQNIYDHSNQSFSKLLINMCNYQQKTQQMLDCEISSIKKQQNNKIEENTNQ